MENPSNLKNSEQLTAVCTTFPEKIRAFNEMYGLPVNTVPTILFSNPAHFIARMQAFKKILRDEIEEVEDIILRVKDGTAGPTDVLVDLADWLGDIQVYCASEMLKFGLDQEIILSIIMASNMSKLMPDGSVLMEGGKVQKGPNYWKPEPMIRRYIQAAVRQHDKEQGAES